MPPDATPASPVPLEDNLGDILAKAMTGRGLTDSTLAELASLPLPAWRRLRKGAGPDPALLATAAAHLGLHAPSLLALAAGRWPAPPPPIPGLHTLVTRWHDLSVNAFLLWRPGSTEAIAIDTGVDADVLLAALETHGLTLAALLITHAHPDHIAGLPALRAAFPDIPIWAPAGEPVEEASPFAPGRTFAVAGLTLHSLPTPGHSPGGASYFLQDLSQPVAIVGDALFAGSIGGPRVSLRLALDSLRAHIFTLPDSTLLCPGHGPLSTVAIEKACNPFFPEFKTPSGQK